MNLNLLRNSIFILGFLFLGEVSWAGPNNIAGEALVSASSILSSEFAEDKIIDGRIGFMDRGDWACKGETVFWGYVKYPWIQLDWKNDRTIDKVLLYDRATMAEHTAGGTLFFSDGTEIVVTAIPNDGTAKLVTFAPKKTKWIRFQTTDGVGKNLGLSEIEVFPAPRDFTTYCDWVDPFIETTRGRYFFFTPGSRPFGMVAAAPHTRIKNQWGGGYNYNSMDILGFGQLHGWMLAGLEIMPTAGHIDPRGGRQAWKSSFSHDDEIAQPGYHRVFLRDHDTWVENTVTDRVSLYRFTFTHSNDINILTNLGGYVGSSTMIGAQVNRRDQQSFEGSFISSGRMWGGPKEIEVFFVIEFDQPFESFSGWKDQELLSDVTTLQASKKMSRMDSMTYGDITQSYWSAPSCGVNAAYKVNPGDQLKMRIAISFTSVQHAEENLREECNHWDFDNIRSEAQEQWNEQLGKIEISGGEEHQRVKFYTDLWHVLLGRQVIDDVVGTYPDYTQGEKDWHFTDADMIVRELPRDDSDRVKFHMYNSDALWLTQWNLNVLWGLAWPAVLDDFSASMVQYADNGGLLPRGPCVGGYSYIMTGCPATNMIASCHMKDLLTKVSPQHALESIARNHRPGGMMGDEEELEFYQENGWCPGNAGKSVEWYYQDWSAAQMAKKIGKQDLYKEFASRAKRWKNLFHPEQKLLFPKAADGTWLHSDALSGHGWIEANSWQGTWSLSHDLEGLADAMGGRDTFASKLNLAFEKAAPDDFVFGYSSGYVSYANQPGCSNAHVFNRIGKPWLSQYWVRRVNEQAYGGTTPDRGYGGHDEDQGQMGGVSALMSIGLFSVTGNNASFPVYDITSPVFDEVTIHLDPKYYDGRKFMIRVHDNSPDNIYIQRARLNGQEHSAAWLAHTDFAEGGTLELWLGDEPNIEWGLVPFPSESD